MSATVQFHSVNITSHILFARVICQGQVNELHRPAHVRVLNPGPFRNAIPLFGLRRLKLFPGFGNLRDNLRHTERCYLHVIG
jgi:hypothetical protein